MKAVILAGGYGKRLRPLTNSIPKVLIPIGRKPILEIIIEQLKENGFREIYLTTGYKTEVIENYFKDGKKFGVSIYYSREDKPLGTAGPLKLLEEELDKDFLVMNGDILTKLHFKDLMDFHLKGKAEMTVGVKEHKVQLPYGTVTTNDRRVISLQEKPELSFVINSGIYALNPDVLKFIPKGKFFGMPDLISTLLREGRRVIAYEIKDYWLDVGKVDDYKKAVNDFEGR